MGGILFACLHRSPEGGSTLITSAPKSERITEAPGAATKVAKSTTLSPEKMLSFAILVSLLNDVWSLPLELRSPLRKKGGCSFLLVFGPRAETEERSF